MERNQEKGVKLRQRDVTEDRARGRDQLKAGPFFETIVANSGCVVADSVPAVIALDPIGRNRESLELNSALLE